MLLCVCVCVSMSCEQSGSNVKNNKLLGKFLGWQHFVTLDILLDIILELKVFCFFFGLFFKKKL